MASKRAKRSKFEEDMAEVLEPAGFIYEPYKVTYWVSHNYTPDFVFEREGKVDLMVECKGYFRPGDTRKYKAIAEDRDEELVFLLMYPNKQVRKGTKLTMSLWCEKEGIKWFATPEEVAQYVYS